MIRSLRCAPDDEEEEEAKLRSSQNCFCPAEDGLSPRGSTVEDPVLDGLATDAVDDPIAAGVDVDTEP